MMLAGKGKMRKRSRITFGGRGPDHRMHHVASLTEREEKLAEVKTKRATMDAMLQVYTPNLRVHLPDVAPEEIRMQISTLGVAVIPELRRALGDR